jgi:hypothetical protein
MSDHSFEVFVDFDRIHEITLSSSSGYCIILSSNASFSYKEKQKTIDAEWEKTEKKEVLRSTGELRIKGFGFGQ